MTFVVANPTYTRWTLYHVCSRETTIYKVYTYGVHIQFWPTLLLKGQTSISNNPRRCGCKQNEASLTFASEDIGYHVTLLLLLLPLLKFGEEKGRTFSSHTYSSQDTRTHTHTHTHTRTRTITHTQCLILSYILSSQATHTHAHTHTHTHTHNHTHAVPYPLIHPLLPRQHAGVYSCSHPGSRKLLRSTSSTHTHTHNHTVPRIRLLFSQPYHLQLHSHRQCKTENTDAGRWAAHLKTRHSQRCRPQTSVPRSVGRIGLLCLVGSSLQLAHLLTLFHKKRRWFKDQAERCKQVLRVKGFWEGCLHIFFWACYMSEAIDRKN